MRKILLGGFILALFISIGVIAAGGRGILFQAIFHASGTGSADRTAFSKLSDVVSVCDFIGAVCPSGGDDAAAINAALTASPGKTVRVPSGTYLISAFLSPGTNTRFVCDGTCTLQPTGGYASYAVQVRANGIAIQGFTFSGFLYGVDANGMADLVLQNNRALSSTGTGLALVSAATQVRVLDNYIDSAGGISLSMHGVSDVIVRGNTITNGGDDCIAVRTLIDSFNTDQTVIADNVLDDCGKAGIKYTVESSSSLLSTAMRAAITGNVIKKWGRNVAESAIVTFNNLGDGSLNQNITIANNTMESANRSNENGYLNVHHNKDIAITGNVMRGGVNASGILLQNCDYATVTGNVIVGAVQVSVATNIGAITVLVTNHSTITGNTIRNTGVSPTNTPSGIYVEQSQYNVLSGNVTVDDRAGSAVMPYGIQMNSAGATKDDFNILMGNLSVGHTIQAYIFNTLQQHQIAFGNHDGALGGITLQGTSATKGSGVRNASPRNIIRNASVAPVDCAAGNIAATVTQMLDGAIFTCATAQTLTTARADGASGMVQALPGTPTVGDIFEFVMSSTAANNFTLVGGINVTLVGNAAVNNSSRLVRCRITAVTANAETATCYL